MDKKFLFLISLIFLAYHAKSQIQIDQSYTPQQLVQDYLIGGGLMVNNITFSGVTSSTCNQIALFNNGNTTSLGMNSGIVIATGCVTDIPQPGSSYMGQSLGGPGVPDLTSLAGNTTFDGAVLEFDFVPLDAQISFTYIFGSEEYPEYVNAGYNDIFAFFITGPKPGGGSYTNQNIALIPGTAIPVSINNVNAGSYAQYFIDNDGTSNQPVFDGFTTPLNAVAEVVPCQTYHLKICIADVGDEVFDSGIFLKKYTSSANITYLNITYSSGTTSAIEGCSTATLTAITNIPHTSNDTVYYTIHGTATNADFTQPVPTSIIIPSGQTSASIILNPVSDSLMEGSEYLVFTVSDSCCNSFNDTLWITDKTAMTVDVGNDITLCTTNTATTLTATVSGVTYPYTYAWNNGAGNTQSISVLPVTDTQYKVTVTDACGQTATDSVNIFISSFPTAIFTATSPVCAGQPVTVTYQGNASANAIYNWNFDGATILSGGTGQGPHEITWTSAGVYTITLSVTENNCTSNSNVSVIINAVDNYTVNISDSTATVSDLPGASYQWIDCQNGNAPIMGETNPTFIATTSGSYGVIINQNGCTSVSSCVYIDTHINQNDMNGTISVFPNPTQGTLYISFEQSMENTFITLTNLLGKKVYESNNVIIQKGTNTTIDLSVLPSGFYFLNIENKNIHTTFKVVYNKIE